ncbi:MAG: DUF4149 domain-containing protein [Candidatus Binatia bacterium]
MPTRAEPSRWIVTLFLTSVGLWMGAAAFFSAGVLPVLFTSLEPSDAGRIAALLFPVYFRAGLAVGVVACVSAALLARGGGRKWQAVVAVLVVMTASQAWSTLAIQPEMAEIRGDAAKVERFQQLHRQSVRLNSVVLGGGILLLLAGGLLFERRRGET